MKFRQLAIALIATSLFISCSSISADTTIMVNQKLGEGSFPVRIGDFNWRTGEGVWIGESVANGRIVVMPADTKSLEAVIRYHNQTQEAE